MPAIYTYIYQRCSNNDDTYIIYVVGVSRKALRHLHNCKTLKKLSLHSHAFSAGTKVDKYIDELKAKLPHCEVVALC